MLNMDNMNWCARDTGEERNVCSADSVWVASLQKGLCPANRTRVGRCEIVLVQSFHHLHHERGGLRQPLVSVAADAASLFRGLLCISVCLFHLPLSTI